MGRSPGDCEKEEKEGAEIKWAVFAHHKMRRERERGKKQVRIRRGENEKKKE